MRLSQRLEVCLSYIKGFKVLYDIGTDHAYLPITAVANGLIQKAYAVDNKPGPLSNAQNNIIEHGMENRVIPVLADGLDALSEDVDVVLVAGLGGPLIAKILKTCPIVPRRRLIAQTSVQAQAIRTLVDAGWCIIDETVTHENDMYYTTIVFEVGAMTLDARTRAFGPVLLKHRPKVFLEQLQAEARYVRKLVATIPDETAKARQLKRLKAIEEVLDERSNHSELF